VRRFMALALIFCAGCACHCPDLIMDSFVGDMVRCTCALPCHFHKSPQDGLPVDSTTAGPVLDVFPGPDGNSPAPAAESGSQKVLPGTKDVKDKQDK
jgi:hypothetical protein